ncbi:glycosyltransferase 61 family protein [Sphingobium sp. SYK-6]|uniref:glycosyltransferase 61 family protein n=1 Tax=Sphingobium sp. (strain NBRC 103272 / SYK-6) TaxID=627192 RepID=UPI00030505F2|nr:glycosyltransferase family 61 protein [Sphingobium sp. SYK-6]
MSFPVRRLIGKLRPRPLTAAAVSSRILCPPSETATPPALHLPGDFDNILAFIGAGKPELERRRTFGEAYPHLPTIEYELRDVRIAGEYLASRWQVARFPTNRPGGDWGDGGHLKDAFLSTNILSGKEFGHWVRDSLVSEMHGNTLGLRSIGLARQLWEHEPGFRALGGLDCDYMRTARVDRLVYVDDRGLNSFWAERFLQLRGRMRANVDKSVASAGALVFLERGGQARTRDPTNQPQVRAALEAIGFRTVTAIDMSAHEIGQALRDAKLIVSVEGSHLNHLHFFAADKATVLTIQDPRRYYSFHKSLIDIYGERFGFLIGRPDPGQEGRYYVELDDLRRLIDLAA